MNYLLKNGILHLDNGAACQCPFRNVFAVPAPTSKLQAQHGQNMTMNIPVCAENCPAFERLSLGKVKLHCFDRLIQVEELMDEKIPEPLTLVPRGNA